jgi:hypothetical protein
MHTFTFKLSIPSLQVACGFACSVASLSLCPHHQLPEHRNLHCNALADHQFDWGELSTCVVACHWDTTHFITILDHKSYALSELHGRPT